MTPDTITVDNRYSKSQITDVECFYCSSVITPYQSFDGRNLRSTCMKLEKWRRMASSPSWWTRANKEEKDSKLVFKETWRWSLRLCLKETWFGLSWQASLTTWLTPWQPKFNVPSYAFWGYCCFWNFNQKWLK